MEEITELFDSIFKIVHYVLVMPIRQKTKNILRFNIIGFSYHFFFTFAYISMMCYYGFTDEDFEEKVIGLDVILTEISFFYKLLNMVFKRNEFYEILEDLNLFQRKSSNNEEKKIIRIYAKKLRKAFYYYAIVTFVCVCVTLLTALFRKGNNLPFKSWYPFNLQNNPKYYWMLYSYQFIGIAGHASLNVFNDAFIMFMMGTIAMQLDILGLRLKRLNMYSKSDSLLSAMKDYDKIIRVSNKFHSLMSSTMFIQIYLSSGVLCLSAYHLSMVC